MYLSNMISQVQGDIQATWRLIKSILTNDASKCNRKKLYVNGKTIITPIANKFNEVFINIGPDLGKRIPAVDGSHRDYMTASDASMFVLTTTGSEIIDIARNLKPSKSPGYDEISLKVIKSIINNIAQPLSDNFYLSQKWHLP